MLRHAVPSPGLPFKLFRCIVASWLVLGLTLVLAVPELRRQISAGPAAR